MDKPTISLCMIVKNEAEVLARCLDSVVDLMDEIIIVDTGSTDDTKEIASRYTDCIYDFAWCDDFSAARNFSFSLATCDYIYAPDADEVLLPEDHEEFVRLKEALLPEVEIVQMKYHTVTPYNTVLNEEMELRPKLFKRLRNFTWIDPIHETVRLDPVVFDSDIVITHMPQQMHSKRDFSIFTKAIARDGVLSRKIIRMYATELYKTGDAEDFAAAVDFFKKEYETHEDDEWHEIAGVILLRAYRLLGKEHAFFAIASREAAGVGCAELCYEQGCFFLEGDETDEQAAAWWLQHAAYSMDPILDKDVTGKALVLLQHL